MLKGLAALFVIALPVCYAGYRAWVAKIRNSKRTHLSDEHPPAQAFYYEGSSKSAILCIHGFSSTPCEMKPLGEFLHKKGYTVRGMLLPGHATNPGDLENMDYHHWRDAVYKEYEKLRDTYESVYVIGFSLGGLLTLDLALEKDPDGMVLLSPFLRMSTYFFPGVNPEWFIRNSTGVVPYVRKSINFVNINDPVMREGHICYTEIPTRPAARMFSLAEKIIPRLKEIKIPTLIMHAKGDRVVAPDGSLEIYQKISSSIKEIHWLQKSNHVIPLDYERHFISHEVITFLEKLQDMRANKMSV